MLYRINKQTPFPRKFSCIYFTKKYNLKMYKDKTKRKRKEKIGKLSMSAVILFRRFHSIFNKELISLITVRLFSLGRSVRCKKTKQNKTFFYCTKQMPPNSSCNLKEILVLLPSQILQCPHKILKAKATLSTQITFFAVNLLYFVRKHFPFFTVVKEKKSKYSFQKSRLSSFYILKKIIYFT